MKKYLLDLRVNAVEALSDKHTLIKLTDEHTLPDMLPGQFVEIRIDKSASTFLRRPISINFVDRTTNELWLLVAAVGNGTRSLTQLHEGDTLNCVLPLGNGFPMPKDNNTRTLLIGGGVGVAPLLYLGSCIKAAGGTPTFILGARKKDDILQLERFEAIGRTLITTEDGSFGERGFVTNHSVLMQEQFDIIYTCGPKPMMKAVARYAESSHTDCYASLENMMACGLGACLCCVEKTIDGNVCVCKEGPVINTKKLLWQI